jgi:hypothetical protein
MPKSKTTVTRRELEKVAREIFRARGKRPTDAQLEKALRHPLVIAEAERRADVLRKISN